MQEEIAPHLVEVNPKPWKQASRSTPRHGRGNRRNAGRDDGRTYVSRRFVCGAAIESEWDGTSDDDAGTDSGERSRDPHAAEGSLIPGPSPMEVCLMDIARPARQRGQYVWEAGRDVKN